MLVTMGLSWHNSVAVMGGLSGRKSPFLRTPKLGGEKPVGAQSTVYRSASGLGWLMEISLAVLFGAAAFHGWTTGRTAFIVMHGMLAVGFALVGLASSLEVFRRWRD